MKLNKDIVKLASKPDKIRLIDDIASQTQINVEADLHDIVTDMLTVRGIKFVHSRMDKATTQQKGVPDFLFTIGFHPLPEMKGDKVVMSWWPIACAWECKMQGEQLTPDQMQWFSVASEPPNSWTCRVIHSFDEASSELRKLGL